MASEELNLHLEAFVSRLRAQGPEQLMVRGRDGGDPIGELVPGEEDPAIMSLAATEPLGEGAVGVVAAVQYFVFPDTPPAAYATFVLGGGEAEMPQEIADRLRAQVEPNLPGSMPMDEPMEEVANTTRPWWKLW